MMADLKDIKGLVEVPDASLWWFVLTVLALLAGAVLLFRLYRGRTRSRRRRRRMSPEEIAVRKLASIDYEDTKAAVYTFSENMKLLADLKGPIPGLQALLEKLERYKYKREVPPLSEEDREAMRAMIKKVIS